MCRISATANSSRFTSSTIAAPISRSSKIETFVFDPVEIEKMPAFRSAMSLSVESKSVAKSPCFCAL